MATAVKTTRVGYTQAEMPVVYIEGKELKREQYLKYLGITFDRSM